MKLNSSVFRTMMLSALLLVGIAAEARVVSGTVKDPTGETIISASVVVKGTTIGTVTDFDGNYSLDVPADAKVLVFSYIGTPKNVPFQIFCRNKCHNKLKVEKQFAKIRFN